MIGPFIVVVGVLFLFSNLGLISPITWSIVWPAIVILIGLSMMRKHGRWGSHCWCGCGDKDCGCGKCDARDKKDPPSDKQ